MWMKYPNYLQMSTKKLDDFHLTIPGKLFIVQQLIFN